MNYGYIRVSTDKQTVKNQKIAIRDYARKYRIRNIQWYEETISGTKSLKKASLLKIIYKAKFCFLLFLFRQKLSGIYYQNAQSWDWHVSGKKESR